MLFPRVAHRKSASRIEQRIRKSDITVYAAIKAFVLEFSQSLYGEWLRRGILVQTVLAGPTETGMAAFPRLKKYGIFEKFMLPAEVVKISLGHLSKRMPIVTPGPRPFLHWLFAPFFQRAW